MERRPANQLRRSAIGGPPAIPLNAQGACAFNIQTILGHSQWSTTNRYTGTTWQADICAGCRRRQYIIFRAARN
jgi:hypothetical protein